MPVRIIILPRRLTSLGINYQTALGEELIDHLYCNLKHSAQIVAQVNGSAATVKIIKSSSCSGCEGCADGGKCQMSYLIGKEPESFEISAENDLNAHVGDVVEGDRVFAGAHLVGCDLNRKILAPIRICG